MLYVSFVEIFVKSLDGFADSSAFGDSDAYLMATAALFGGMGFMSGLDALVHWLDPNRSAHHASDPRKHMVRASGVLFFVRLRRVAVSSFCSVCSMASPRLLSAVAVDQLAHVTFDWRPTVDLHAVAATRHRHATHSRHHTPSTR